MKNIFKFYLPLLIFLSALGILFLGYMIKNHVVILKYIAGEAKIITNQLDATVKEDGVEQDSVKLFDDEGKFYLVFKRNENYNFEVLILDKTKEDIFRPNIGNCYELLFSKYLLQADCGRGGVPYSNVKSDMYDVKFQSTDSEINFQLPEYKNGKLERDRKIEIVFKGE